MHWGWPSAMFRMRVDGPAGCGGRARPGALRTERLMLQMCVVRQHSTNDIAFCWTWDVALSHAAANVPYAAALSVQGANDRAPSFPLSPHTLFALKFDQIPHHQVVRVIVIHVLR